MQELSQIFGLAGLRGGYVANKFLAKQLFSLKPMYEINSLAVLIIKEFIRKKLQINMQPKQILEKNFN